MFFCIITSLILVSCFNLDSREVKETCEKCNGEGQIGITCPECDDEGEVVIDEVDYAEGMRLHPD